VRFAIECGLRERLFPLDALPARQVLLAVPSFGVSSADAFGWFAEQKASRHSGTRATLPVGRKLEWKMIAALAANDLEGVVIAHHPQIGTLRDGLRRSGAILAQMSGSGSTVFGVFDATGATVSTFIGDIERIGASVLVTGTVETVAVVDLT